MNYKIHDKVDAMHPLLMQWGAGIVMDVHKNSVKVAFIGFHEERGHWFTADMHKCVRIRQLTCKNKHHENWLEAQKTTNSTEHEVEKITGHRMQRTVLQFRVKWTGFRRETWEDAIHCTGAASLVLEHFDRAASEAENPNSVDAFMHMWTDIKFYA